MTKELQDLIAKVATHLSVNADETPTIATVTDANVLRAQNPTFYKDAQNGDRLLIWSNQAVLYSPAADKILAVLPISLPSNAGGSVAAAASSTAPVVDQTFKDVTIDVRNGSGVTGLANALVQRLQAVGFASAKAKNALVKTPYPQTQIFKLGQKDLSLVSTALSNFSGFKVQDGSTAPVAELPSKSDFLIILGQDAQQK